MRRRRSQSEEVGFNITPMIDLTFLLLIFFMVTSKLSKEQKKMDIALPLAASAVRPEDLSNRDIINVDPRGVLHVGDSAAAKPASASPWTIDVWQASLPWRTMSKASP